MSEINLSNNSLGKIGPALGYYDAADMSGVVAISDAIPTMEALTSLHIGNNQIPTENMNEIIAIVEAQPAMKILCAVPFRDKTVIELDVSGHSLGLEGALVVGRYLEIHGALEIITFGDTQAVTMKTSMTEADFSGKRLGVSGAIMLAAFLPQCQ